MSADGKPDRDAVREALVCVLQSASLKSVDNLDDVLGSRHTAKFEDTADALLAAVSRPAEARGEPWGYACRVRYTDNVASDWWIRFRTEELPTSQQAQVIPLYAHPAPSGGEAYSKRVVRDEPGVTEIHVEARQVLRDGPMRVECWWSDEDGAYIASLTDDEERGRPFTATHTGIGATREEALAHLAVAEYVTALAVAAPRPETGEP